MVAWTRMVVRCARFGYLDVARRHFDEIPRRRMLCLGMKYAECLCPSPPLQRSIVFVS